MIQPTVVGDFTAFPARCSAGYDRRLFGLVPRRFLPCPFARSIRQWRVRGKPVSEPVPIFDLVIAGAGVSGLALAAAGKHAMRSGASIALVDPARPPAAGAARLRTVAIADGPRRLFERVGAWQAIGPNAPAVLKMAIMDGQERDAVRPTHLNFEAKSSGPLAHMAFNDDVVGALAALCDRLEVH